MATEDQIQTPPQVRFGPNLVIPLPLYHYPITFPASMDALRGVPVIVTKKPGDRFCRCFQVTTGLEDLGNLVSASYQVVPCIPLLMEQVFQVC